MNKKGFTLIELLAVIVILAIIAVIAVPIVLNIINETKESATLRSAEMYVKAAEMSIAQSTLKDINIPADEYQIKDGDICLNDGCTETLKVEVNGEVPTSGKITIAGGNISSIELTYKDGKTIVKDSNGDLVYKDTPAGPSLASLCELKDGTEKTIGAKYECDFGGGIRKFYILDIGINPVNQNLKKDEVALILEGNYDTTTQAWCASGSDNSCNAYGLTSKLDDIAEAWKELERDQIGLPSAEQIMVADGKSKNEYTNYPLLTNSWLYNWPDNPDYSLGKNPPCAYWTSTPYADNSDSAWIVYFTGDVDDDGVDYGFDYGVRPVVNLKI